VVNKADARVASLPWQITFVEKAVNDPFGNFNQRVLNRNPGVNVLRRVEAKAMLVALLCLEATGTNAPGVFSGKPSLSKVGLR